MKNLLFLFSFLFISTISSANINIIANENDILESFSISEPIDNTSVKLYSDFDLRFTVHVKFRRPKTGCLKGFGICVFITIEDYELSPDTNNNGTGGGYARRINNNVELEVLKSTLSETTIQEQFSNGVFKIIDPFELSEEVCNLLNLESYTLMPGNYPIVDTGETYKIVF